MVHLKILLIDDDDLVVRSLKRLLTSKGYSVETANSALEAIAIAAVTNFDLVISDIRMPGENGIAAIETIKSIYTSKKLTCGYIIISGYAEEDTPAHAVRLGVSKFLYKPIDTDLFLKNIEDECELVRKERDLKKAPGVAPSIIARKAEKGKETKRRAVITGIGVVAPNGIGKEAYWDGLREGKNCVDEITSFDISTYPSKMAAEVKNFDPSRFVTQFSEIKRMGRSSHLAIAAAKLAVEDDELNGSLNSYLSVLLGSATAGIEYIVPDVRALEKGGVRRMRPYLGIAGFGGSISSEVSRAIGAQGPSHTISTGCTSSTDAMGYALRQIQHGLSDIIITGGADACVNDGILGAFCQMGAVSTRNHEYKKASRPFNKDRDGFVIAEGAWIFVVEELERALKRKKSIYGELIGYASTCDAWHMAKPHPSGEYTAKAISLALGDANISPEEVNIFEAYGNATPVNDSYETAVIKKIFGRYAYKMLVPSVKSMLGHPIGAAGAQQMAAVLLALNQGVIHPTINYEVPDPECDLDCVPNVSRKGDFNIAVCNSLAFGSKNSAIIVKKYV